LDSIRYTIKGTDPVNPGAIESLSSVSKELNGILTPILNDKLTKSKQGYIRVNLDKLLIHDTIFVSVYLDKDIDSLQSDTILHAISKMAGVIHKANLIAPLHHFLRNVTGFSRACDEWFSTCDGWHFLPENTWVNLTV
jgi:hypothetical protein